MNTRMQGLVLWTSEKQLRDERHIHTHTHAYTLAPKTAGQIVDRVNGYTYKNVFHTFFSIYLFYSFRAAERNELTLYLPLSVTPTQL